MRRTLLAGIAVLALTLPAQADQVAFTFSGVADGATRPFHIDGPWELQWATGTGLMMVRLNAPDGSLIDSYAVRPPGGSAYEPKGGDFYLVIGADAGWSVKVVRVGP